MKKLQSIVVLVVLTLVLTACGSSSSETSGSGEPVTLTIGATPIPHAEILKKAKPILKEKGIKLEIKEFSQYAIINKALASGDLDANFFQHIPYLKQQEKEFGYEFASVGKVHIEPMGIYSKKYESIKQLPKNAEIIISKSVAEQERILKLIESTGLIKLSNNPGNEVTVKDIVKNPKNVQIKPEVAPAMLPAVYRSGEADAYVINTNYALEAGLNPTKDAIAMESKDSPYANIIVVREEDKNKPAIQKLVNVLQSEKIQKWILKEYNGAVVPAGPKK